MTLSIRYKLLAVYIITISLIVFGLSFHQYTQQYITIKKQITHYKVDLSQRFISEISSSIAGNNYSNLMLPMFTRLLKQTPSLLSLEINGLSDKNDNFKIIYSSKLNKIWRSTYPDGHLKELEFKKVKLTQRLQKNDDETIKINYLLARIEDQLIEYYESYSFNKKHSKINNIDESIVTSKLDLDTWQLQIKLPTINQNKGTLFFLYDVNELKDIKENLIQSFYLQILITIIMSIILVTLLTIWLLRPIEKLTEFILNTPIQVGDRLNVPFSKQNDEIGKLAKTFGTLINQIRNDFQRIELLTIKDPLTQLFNRRYYNEQAPKELLRAKRNKHFFSFLYIDIDNFKKYNDFYGHIMGDNALKLVAKSFHQTLRKEDICIRLGGEEFLIILTTPTAEIAFNIAEKIRSDIQSLNIKHVKNLHYNVLTVSIGIASLPPFEKHYQINTDVLLKVADNQLFRSKKSGRNQVNQQLISKQ